MLRFLVSKVSIPLSVFLCLSLLKSDWLLAQTDTLPAGKIPLEIPLRTYRPPRAVSQKPAFQDTTYRNRRAQGDTLRDTLKNPGVPQKDLSDVLRRIFKKRRPALTKDTATNVRKPTFSGLPAVGYTLTTKTAVTLSGNAAFRTSDESRLSTIVASAAYTQNKQFTVPLETSIWTRGDKYNFVGDIHFMKYPQSTFGLGSNSPIENEDPMDYRYIRFYEIVYRKISSDFFLGGGYIIDWHYDITEQGLPGGGVSDYAKYGAASNTLSTGFTLNGLYDTRDNSINPYKGFYTELTYRNYQRFMGSNSDWQSAIIDVRKYVRFPASSKNILAFWSYDWLTLNGHPPYLDLPSTNWDRFSSTGRGYIQGRFRGKEMVYLESEYRFPLTANGFLGGVAFVNAESLSGLENNRLQSVQPGFGAGLRIKLNKASRTNVDIDYGFGAQGSHGLFVNVGELF